jgi:hypothetical protein
LSGVAGATASANGVHIEYITDPGGNNQIGFFADATFIGTIDDVEVNECYPVSHGGGAIRRRRRGKKR